MTSRTMFSPARWLPWVMAAGAFWLSSSLLLDLVIMPVMYTSGMMAEPGFAPAGYTLFWTFNRLELVCAALILTGVLALRRQPGEFDVLNGGSRSRWALGIGLLLITLTLICTYGLTPEMGALGVSLDSFAEANATPAAMDWLHGAYWAVEILKLSGLGLLTGLCYQDMSQQNGPGAIS
ncbi:MAG: hypothetical protein O3A14_05280 [Cyanobacteria bacterium]|nr:hypothetical protein [Cyanobacteriota bacterium]